LTDWISCGPLQCSDFCYNRDYKRSLSFCVDLLLWLQSHVCLLSCRSSDSGDGHACVYCSYSLQMYLETNVSTLLAQKYHVHCSFMWGVLHLLPDIDSPVDLHRRYLHFSRIVLNCLHNLWYYYFHLSYTSKSPASSYFSCMTIEQSFCLTNVAF
jgi:hypothetical protein